MSMGSEHKIYPRPGSGMGGYGNTPAYSPEVELQFEGQFVKMTETTCPEGAGLGRNELCFCGSGIKQKRCHSDIKNNSMMAQIIQKYNALDEDIQKMGEQKDVTFVCKKGCSDCCSDYFYISLMEYFYIKYWLLKHDPAQFERVKEQANRQLEDLRDKSKEEYDRIFEVDRSNSDIVDATKYINKLGACVFLNDGCCTVYGARPKVCRTYGVTVTRAPCPKIAEKMVTNSIEALAVPIDTMSLDQGINRFQRKDQTVILRTKPIIYWLYKDKQYQKNYEDSLSMSADHYFDVHYH